MLLIDCICVPVLSCQTATFLLTDLIILQGNPDKRFLDIYSRKGIGQIVDGIQFSYKGDTFTRTIRSLKCSILKDENRRCLACQKHRESLRVLCNRKAKAPYVKSKFAANRSLNSPQRRKKMKELAMKNRIAQQKIRRLTEKIQKSIDESGVAVNNDMHDDLCSIITEKTSEVENLFPEGSFRFESQFLK